MFSKPLTWTKADIWLKKPMNTKETIVKNTQCLR